MVEPTSALGNSPFHPHYQGEEQAIAAMTWTFDIILEKKKETKKE